MSKVFFLGGNGHAVARLAPARDVLVRRGESVELVDAEYPGFEGRPRAASFEAFLDAVNARFEEAAPQLVYATGIGGLIALALRARGQLRVPLVLQGAVLWGLEHRTFARIMRGPMPALLALALRTPIARRRFRKKHLFEGIDPEVERGFFRGYEQCAAFPDFFRWMRAPLLRDLERAFAANPERLADVTFWWGARDHVVTLEELRVSEAALGVEFECVRFDDWAHYPMLEDPEGWVEALVRALA